jgi:flagellar hook-associated protein 3 FlgL
MRITNGMLTSRALQNLQTNFAGLAKVQEQVSSGRRLNRPSDDPAQVRSAVKVRESIAALTQNLRNIDAAERTTNTSENALSLAGDTVIRLKEIALQAANDTISAADRASILAEVQQLGESLVSLANTKSGEDYVFSGQKTRVPAYATAAATYAGDAGSLTARISPGVSVAVNVTADDAFGPALAAVVQLTADLGAGTRPSVATLNAIDTGQDALLEARSRIGAVANRLTETRVFIEDSQFAATSMLSRLEDADFAAVVSEAATRQATYEAAISVNAKIMRRSLVDEL